MSRVDREYYRWITALVILMLFSSAGAWHVLNDHKHRLEVLEEAAGITSKTVAADDDKETRK